MQTIFTWTGDVITLGVRSFVLGVINVRQIFYLLYLRFAHDGSRGEYFDQFTLGLYTFHRLIDTKVLETGKTLCYFVLDNLRSLKYLTELEDHTN